ncbi:MAG: hypothetical protein ACOYD1_12755 [Candidatus Nanopelagicales bacterium]
MHRIFNSLRALGQLADVLEPPPPAGTEHVMVEIAPGVFRSVNRQRRAPASRLLLELEQAKQLHDNLSGEFKRVRQVLRASQKPAQGKVEGIPDARRSRQR